MNKQTQESEAMGSEAAMLRAELEAAQAELSTIYQWVRERRDYAILSLTDEVASLKAEIAELQRGIAV